MNVTKSKASSATTHFIRKTRSFSDHGAKMGQIKKQKALSC